MKRATNSAASIEALIEKAWPDGIIESIAEDESYFGKIYQKLKTNIAKVPGTGMYQERSASPDISSIHDWDDDEDDVWPNEAWEEESRSYHLFLIPPKPAIRLSIDLEQASGEDDLAVEGEDEDEDDFSEDDFDEPEVIGHSFGFLVAISLVAPVAIVMDYAIVETEYGTDFSLPLGLPFAFDSANQEVEPDHRSDLNARDRKRVDVIKRLIVRVLETAGLKVLPFDERRKIVPGLKADFLGEKLTVQDAFFFEDP